MKKRAKNGLRSAGITLASALSLAFSLYNSGCTEIQAEALELSESPAVTIVEPSEEQEDLENVVEEPIEVNLQAYSNKLLQRVPDHEDRDLINAVAENEDIIQDYVDVTGLPFALIASQLYTESKFDPNLRSTADAYGLGQLTEVAYLETMYTVLAVPGGFDKQGKSKVTSLASSHLANERYTNQRELYFPDLRDSENEVYGDLDTIFVGSTGFSTNEYMERIQDRIVEYDQLNDEYLTYTSEENGHWNHRKRINEINEDKDKLLNEQQEDNKELRTALLSFWKTEISSHKGTRFPESKKRPLLWYTLEPETLPEDFHANLDLLTQLNMIREYGPTLADGTDFDIHSEAMETAILEYNTCLDYLGTIQDRHDRIGSFLALAESGGKIKFN